jgi:hypothetical protein
MTPERQCLRACSIAAAETSGHAPIASIVGHPGWFGSPSEMDDRPLVAIEFVEHTITPAALCGGLRVSVK